MKLCALCFLYIFSNAKLHGIFARMLHFPLKLNLTTFKITCFQFSLSFPSSEKKPITKKSCEQFLCQLLLFSLSLASGTSTFNSTKTTPTKEEIGNFSKHFLLPLFGGKTKSSTEFQNSILDLFHLNNSYFTAIVEVILLIHYPREKHFKERYIFRSFYSGSGFSSNLSVFKWQNFYSLSWATMGAL